MSNSFNDQLSRMKVLMTYGSVNEDTKPISTYTIEYRAKAADGKFYGIIRENSKYYVKVAEPGKETIAESYQYIGGITNKPNYEYSSYTNALKQFELKLGSINEAYDENRRVVTEALDPFKKEDLVIEGTDQMKNELARQRQIMRNASVIMNEATEIGSTPFKSQPESEHDNSGDKDYPFTKEGKPEEDRGAIPFADGKPEQHSTTFGPDSKDVEKLGSAKDAKVSDSVASEHPTGGKVARVNESMEECGGLFAEEGDEPELEAPVDEPVDTDELDSIEGPDAEIEDGAVEAEDDFGDENFEDEEGDFGDDEFDDDDDFDFEDGEFDDEDFDDEEDDEFAEEGDDEFGEEESDEFSDDEDGDEFGEEEDFEVEPDADGGEEIEGEEFKAEEEPEIELDENIVKKFRKLVRESINEMMSEWNGSDELEREEMFGDDDEKGDEEEFPDSGMYDRDHERDEMALMDLDEAKAAKMNSIVESVVNDILNEDELHVFGDHPGYRKKPFTLPQTGSDKFQVNRDWNDDSVHNEEPFGQGKGDSTPFDQLVAQITDSVMKQINESKKKVK